MDYLRLLEWFDDAKRKAAKFAFTDGDDRQAAELMEYAEKRAGKLEKGIIIVYSLEERDKCGKKIVEVIDLLKPLSIKEKWLVISTLKDSFPKEDLMSSPAEKRP